MKPLWLALLLAGPVFAQDYPKREVFGTIGIGKTYDDEGSLGSGLNGSGGFGYRLTRRLGVEAEVNAFRTTREFGSQFPPFRASGLHVMGNGVLYLNRGKAQAYLLFGAGLAHARVQSNFAGFHTPAGNGLAVNLGFGVKAFVTQNISLRPEIRLYGADTGNVIEAPFVDLRISMGVGYHW
jgi:hypothetical protein